MTILTVNTGSSSVRMALYTQDVSPRRLSERQITGSVLPTETLREFIGAQSVRAVAHRVVHGGYKLTRPCVIDANVEAEIERLAPLAPLHNPVALAWIRACRDVLGDGVPQVAVFDTGFYARLPDVGRTYALPRALVRKHGIRRYGFHGLAHEALWRRWLILQPEITNGARVISLQLGAGCSITAVRDGVPVDTSMGFSPLEGLVMATRSGDVDPGLLLYLQRAEGMTPERLEKLLNEESGLLGVSGASSDMRTLLASSDSQSRLAVDLYCYRARKYIGAYLATLGGADAILFGGGVGEHAPAVRAKILEHMEWTGIVLDAARNDVAIGTEVRISDLNSKVEVWVVPVDEAVILAQAAQAVLGQAAPTKEARL